MSEQTETGLPSPLNIPDPVYNRVFQQDGDGAAILQELTAIYYDGQLFNADSDRLTSFNLGARSVVEYIMRRSAQ